MIISVSFFSNEGFAPSRRKSRRLQTNSSTACTPSGAFLVLQLHDELIYEVRREDVQQVARLIQAEMEGAMKLSVRLPVKVKVGPTWGALEEMDLWFTRVQTFLTRYPHDKVICELWGRVYSRWHSWNGGSHGTLCHRASKVKGGPMFGALEEIELCLAIIHAWYLLQDVAYQKKKTIHRTVQETLQELEL